MDWEDDKTAYCFSRLNLERRRELWPEINGKPLGKKVSGYFKDNYGEITEDCYGGKITYLEAGELLELKNHESVRDNFTNRAIWAYLAELPADHKIILYWS